MSVTDLSTPTPSETRSTTSTASPRSVNGWWVRIGLACALLVASGLIRSWQAVRIRAEIARGLNDSFPLDSLPLTLGDWQGEPTKLNEEIARGTGAKQIVTRRYVNQNTGVALDVILLFGQAVDMYIHSPELCYPSAGFALLSGPDLRMIHTPSGDAPFRALVYAKGDGASANLQEVYYSWRYNGRWSPEIGTQKHFERISGMYKIHIARHATGREARYEGNPSEAFLRVLIPEIEHRAAAVGSSRS